jgi:flagellar biosynthesis protein FliP
VLREEHVPTSPTARPRPGAACARRAGTGLLLILLLTLLALVALVALAGPASAQVAEPPLPPVDLPERPTPPTPGGGGDEGDEGGGASISIDLGDDGDGAPSQSVLVILLLTLLAVAPALLIMLTSFTRIVIVLSLTRNALGLQGVPPNQVLVGLALFLSLFVMAPTLGEINDVAIQPLLNGEKTQQEAYEAGTVPVREFLLSQTRKGELAMFTAAASGERPATPDEVSLTALIPAFILSELKTAFIIGFIVFIPFLVIDIVVSSSLMSMGMMMLPPVLVSLPFKLLLFVMVDGWGMVVRSLMASFS